MIIETQSKSLNVAVVRFPGSNCDLDTIRFFRRGGHKAEYLWHQDTTTPDADLMVLPGGFAFGDRVYERATHEYQINPGVQALKSPVMDVVRKWADKGKPTLGICNGFQILVHAGLLPGMLSENESGKFFCDDVTFAVEGKSFFGDQSMVGNAYRINVAHGFGRYEIDNYAYHDLLVKGQVFLRYQGYNPNGSEHNIAGICNSEGNIFGMMPHPERADPETRGCFLKAIELNVRR